jgi:hypothetical protein
MSRVPAMTASKNGTVAVQIASFAKSSRHEGKLQRAKRWIFFIFMLFICSHRYVSVRVMQAVISGHDCLERIKANPSVMIKFHGNKQCGWYVVIHLTAWNRYWIGLPLNVRWWCEIDPHPGPIIYDYPTPLTP